MVNGLGGEVSGTRKRAGGIGRSDAPRASGLTITIVLFTRGSLPAGEISLSPKAERAERVLISVSETARDTPDKITRRTIPALLWIKDKVIYMSKKITDLDYHYFYNMSMKD